MGSTIIMKYTLVFLLSLGVAFACPAQDGKEVCDHEGNNKNPGDCCSYYSCRKDGWDTWISEIFYCPPHTAYSELKNSCIEPSKVPGCEDVDCPKQDVKLTRQAAEIPCKHAGNNANPDDCCTFYSCWTDQFGQWVWNILHCPAHSAFSEEEDSCVAPAKVKGCEKVDCPKPEVNKSQYN